MYPLSNPSWNITSDSVSVDVAPSLNAVCKIQTSSTKTIINTGHHIGEVQPVDTRVTFSISETFFRQFLFIISFSSSLLSSASSSRWPVEDMPRTNGRTVFQWNHECLQWSVYRDTVNGGPRIVSLCVSRSFVINLRNGRKWCGKNRIAADRRLNHRITGLNIFCVFGIVVITHLWTLSIVLFW